MLGSSGSPLGGSSGSDRKDEGLGQRDRVERSLKIVIIPLQGKAFVK